MRIISNFFIKHSNWMKQRAKLYYLKIVDRNTTFFHAWVERNNKQREIVAIQKQDGELTTNLDEVVAEV